MSGDHLIVMARPPVPGKVKSRLAAEVGDKKALEIYEQLLNRTATMLKTLPESTKVTISWSEPCPSSIRADMFNDCTHSEWTQPESDLGVRMSETMKRSVKEGFDKTILIGVDCPDLKREDMARAFELLNTTPVVIGPAEDGGYYLIGSTQVYPALFPMIEWGSDAVFSETVASLNSDSVPYSLLAKKADIDRKSDWDKLITYNNG